jgi:hypothetical protein
MAPSLEPEVARSLAFRVRRRRLVDAELLVSFGKYRDRPLWHLMKDQRYVQWLIRTPDIAVSLLGGHFNPYQVDEDDPLWRAFLAALTAPQRRQFRKNILNAISQDIVDGELVIWLLRFELNEAKRTYRAETGNEATLPRFKPLPPVDGAPEP